jgi:phytoene synthase
MSGAATSKDSAAFCADLVRTHDFARYASTLFLPQVQRRALLSVYAFNVEISRVREQVSQPLPGEMRLQWWTDMVEGAGHGGVEGNPVSTTIRCRRWRRWKAMSPTLPRRCSCSARGSRYSRRP